MFPLSLENKAPPALLPSPNGRRTSFHQRDSFKICSLAPCLVLLGLIAILGLALLGEHVRVQNMPNLGVPVDWERHCQEQPSLNDAYVDSLPPARIFMGVLTYDENFSRRQLIRSTYLKNKPESLTFKFVLGRPKPKNRKLILEEQRAYNDILVLDIEENMNSGKTYHYMKFLAEHFAESPFDFVVKADDDSFVMLERLERHLRVLPRTKAYWGYLVGDLFMGGECYALSWDLIEWVANSETARKHQRGHEDSLVAHWFLWSQYEVNYHPERCHIFDDPEAGTVYSRPFGLSPIDKTIVVHYLKGDDRFLTASQVLMGNSTWRDSLVMTPREGEGEGGTEKIYLFDE